MFLSVCVPVLIHFLCPRSCPFVSLSLSVSIPVPVLLYPYPFLFGNGPCPLCACPWPFCVSCLSLSNCVSPCPFVSLPLSLSVCVHVPSTCVPVPVPCSCPWSCVNFAKLIPKDFFGNRELSSLFYFQKIQRITFKAIFVTNGQLSEFVTPGWLATDNFLRSVRLIQRKQINGSNFFKSNLPSSAHYDAL